MNGISQFAINPSLFSKLSYETLRDFAPLSLVGSAPQLLVVNPGIASKSVAELVQLAKAKPGTVNYGSGGAGTLAYLGGEMFDRSRASTSFTFHTKGPCWRSMIYSQPRYS